MRFAHLSDLHFGSIVSQEHLAALTKDLQTRGLDLIVNTGDLTNRGRVGEYKWAKTFIERVGVEMISVPGNREVPFSAAWEWIFPRLAMNRYRRFIGPSDRIIHCDEKNKICFIGINSVHPFPSWPGQIARDTRYWLMEKAESLKGYKKVLFLHHPVIPVIRASSFWAHQLSNAGEVLNICSEFGISVILQGHKHRSVTARIAFPERGSNILVSCGGAPLTSRWDATYHILEMENSGISVEIREFNNGAFEMKSRYEFLEQV
jgi:3',5'-cyclic AMP phosphodiesterase CpdA